MKQINTCLFRMVEDLSDEFKIIKSISIEDYNNQDFYRFNFQYESENKSKNDHESRPAALVKLHVKVKEDQQLAHCIATMTEFLKVFYPTYHYRIIKFNPFILNADLTLNMNDSSLFKRVILDTLIYKSRLLSQQPIPAQIFMELIGDKEGDWDLFFRVGFEDKVYTLPGSYIMASEQALLPVSIISRLSEYLFSSKGAIFIPTSHSDDKDNKSAVNQSSPRSSSDTSHLQNTSSLSSSSTSSSSSLSSLTIGNSASSSSSSTNLGVFVLNKRKKTPAAQEPPRSNSPGF